jgi:hypothetical protein
MVEQLGPSALAAGFGAVLTLLIADATVSDNLWCATWFQMSFATAGLFALVGLYMILSAYLPLPVPSTLAERQPTHKDLAPFDLRNDGMIIDRLRSCRTDYSRISIVVFPPHQMSLARQIASLFELAQWPTHLSETPQEAFQHRYVEGVTVIGYNHALLSQVPGCGVGA